MNIKCSSTEDKEHWAAELTNITSCSDNSSQIASGRMRMKFVNLRKGKSWAGHGNLTYLTEQLFYCGHDHQAAPDDRILLSNQKSH